MDYSAGRVVDVIGVPRGLDATSILTCYLAALLALPSQLVVAPLGGAGSPALLIGVSCLIWWCLAQVEAPQDTPETTWNPVRFGVFIFVVAVGCSYVAAMSRPINAEESSTATLALVAVAGWLGVFLLAHDGVDQWDSLSQFVGRLAIAGGMLALLGLVQFMTNQVWIDKISIPGLTANTTVYGAQSREGFTRPSGTAIHPIEYGAVLAMLLPVALASAIIRGRRSALHWFYPVGIFLCILLSSSRSAFLACGVGLVVLIPGLSRPHRRAALLALPVALMGVFVLVPGMIGSMLGLFLGVGTDSSSQSRFDSYGVALDYFLLAPVFGRGLSTFLPRYRIFDNQYLVLLVETGIVGIMSVALMFALAIYAATWARRRSTSSEMALSVQALLAAVCAGATSLALFDAFSFPMVPGLIFLLLGTVGSGWKIVRRDRSLIRDHVAPAPPIKSDR